MSDDLGVPTVTGPGRGHQWARTVSAIVAAISAIAVALGVLTMAEESIDHTGLINDQNELLQRQADLLQCSIDHASIWRELDEYGGDLGLARLADLLIADQEVIEACTSDAYPEWDD